MGASPGGVRCGSKEMDARKGRVAGQDGHHAARGAEASGVHADAAGFVPQYGHHHLSRDWAWRPFTGGEEEVEKEEDRGGGEEQGEVEKEEDEEEEELTGHEQQGEEEEKRKWAHAVTWQAGGEEERNVFWSWLHTSGQFTSPNRI